MRTSWDVEQLEVANPLETLREQVQAVRVAHLPELPPFIGGAVGYAGYDTVRYVERLPNAPEDDRGLPDLAFGLFDHMVVFDNVRKTVHVLVLADLRGADDGDELAAPPPRRLPPRRRLRRSAQRPRRQLAPGRHRRRRRR